MSQFAQQATVIAASFMEVFSQEAIFKMFGTTVYLPCAPYIFDKLLQCAV